MKDWNLFYLVNSTGNICTSRENITMVSIRWNKFRSFTEKNKYPLCLFRWQIECNSCNQFSFWNNWKFWFTSIFFFHHNVFKTFNPLSCWRVLFPEYLGYNMVKTAMLENIHMFPKNHWPNIKIGSPHGRTIGHFFHFFGYWWYDSGNIMILFLL